MYTGDVHRIDVGVEPVEGQPHPQLEAKESADTARNGSLAYLPTRPTVEEKDNSHAYGFPFRSQSKLNGAKLPNWSMGSTSACLQGSPRPKTE
jgi:hypothetical protein